MKFKWQDLKDGTKKPRTPFILLTRELRLVSTVSWLFIELI